MDALRPAKKFFTRRLTGLDTVEAAYYFSPTPDSSFSFAGLMAEKERLQAGKGRHSAVVEIGGREFLLRPQGTASGYSLVLDNPEFRIQCGEFNSPSFFVTFRSQALWGYGARTLHDTFLAWAASCGLVAVQPERVSRVDFTFDYEIPEPRFDLEQVVSLSSKDSTHRRDRTLQTMSLGTGDVRLRIYDKVAEIREKSAKVWFFDLWGVASNVWRIEWQVRKALLRRFGIETFDDFFAHHRAVLQYLATEHDTLRVPGPDSNRSRWALQPLWADLQQQIEEFDGHGPFREIDRRASLNERQRRIAVSVDGYIKGVAAIQCVLQGRDRVSSGEALECLIQEMNYVHDPVLWQQDVARKRDSLRLGGD